MTRQSWLRAGLWFLTVTNVGVGLWQLLLPRSFFAIPWVALLPPYNDHLMRDVGALNLSTAVVLAAAAVTMERRLVRVALLAYLVFSVPHFVFHATHLQHFPLADAVGQTAALGSAVVIPVALLLLTRVALRSRRQ